MRGELHQRRHLSWAPEMEEALVVGIGREDCTAWVGWHEWRQEVEVLIGKSERGSVWQRQGLGLDGSLNSGRALGLYPKGRGELLRSCSRDWKEDPGGQGTPEPVRSVQGYCDCLGNPCPCPACANNPRNPRDPEVAHV